MVRTSDIFGVPTLCLVVVVFADVGLSVYYCTVCSYVTSYKFEWCTFHLADVCPFFCLVPGA